MTVESQRSIGPFQILPYRGHDSLLQFRHRGLQIGPPAKNHDIERPQLPVNSQLGIHGEAVLAIWIPVRAVQQDDIGSSRDQRFNDESNNSILSDLGIRGRHKPTIARSGFGLGRINPAGADGFLVDSTNHNTQGPTAYWSPATGTLVDFDTGGQLLTFNIASHR